MDERPYRKFRGRMKIDVNKLIKWSLMSLPVIAAALIIISVILNGITYKIWGGICGAFTFLNFFYTVAYFLEPKYYAKRSKKYMPFWLIFGALGLIGAIAVLTYGNTAIYIVGPLLGLSLICGAIKIEYTHRKYLI